MLAADTEMFLLIPGGADPVLRPGRVIASDAATFQAEFEEAIAPAIDADVTAYATLRGKFCQQGARVVMIVQTEPKTRIAFARVGQPVSADKRQVYRVSTVTAGMTARIGNERKCHVVDMSCDGFGAILARECRLGSVMQAVLEHEGTELAMTVRTQTSAKRPDGKFRCGFLVVAGKNEGRKILQNISAKIQREQLRRLAGAA